MSTLEQIAKDELLGRLTAAQAAQARAVATSPPCPWCLEAAGWCDATGGPHLCEGHDEHALAVADAVTAPELRAPFRTEGPRP